MLLRDENFYHDWKNKNQDGYGAAIFRYAERWADLMEKAVADGKRLVDVADALSHEADSEGISGFMHGTAVSILAQCWQHGEELRRWHNIQTQIGHEGEAANLKESAVLNPALLLMVEDKI